MKLLNRAGAGVAVAVLLSGPGWAAEAPVSDSQVVGGVWQPHKARISYFGITSIFTCSGLEDHVREILVHLGARKDARVHASGCPGPDRPSPTAWIDAEFSTLAPTDNLQGPDVVKAYWAQREIGPRRPFFMGEGDCELVDQLEDTIKSSFALRDLQYRANCVPHQITLNGFQVKAEALVAVPEPKRASMSTH